MCIFVWTQSFKGITAMSLNLPIYVWEIQCYSYLCFFLDNIIVSCMLTFRILCTSLKFWNFIRHLQTSILKNISGWAFSVIRKFLFPSHFLSSGSCWLDFILCIFPPPLISSRCALQSQIKYRKMDKSLSYYFREISYLVWFGSSVLFLKWSLGQKK